MINTVIHNFAAENTEEASGFAALGFDVKAFLIQLVTFLLVFYILKRFVFGKVVDMLEKRRETIEEGVKLSQEAKARSEELDREIDEAHKKARADADKLLAQTREQAESIIREAEDSAVTKAENILSEAKKKINEETERARRSLERETVDLVIEATEAVSREKLDAKKDANLIKDALRSQA
ncbi:F0F1 ATP synthase subunit B [Candidatus Parcubacteria bacterium]|nr:F0F1 ATP synthase subunit B [Candidatus Parcubacteria bacterium]